MSISSNAQKLSLKHAGEPQQPGPQAALVGEEGDSYPMPLGPSICLALEPWHLLTSIVRLRQMTGQDSQGRTLVNCVLCFLRTHAGATCVLQKPSRTRGKGGQALAMATLFVEVAHRSGKDSMSQRTR